MYFTDSKVADEDPDDVRHQCHCKKLAKDKSGYYFLACCVSLRVRSFIHLIFLLFIGTALHWESGDGLQPARLVFNILLGYILHENRKLIDPLLLGHQKNVSALVIPRKSRENHPLRCNLLLHHQHLHL